MEWDGDTLCIRLSGPWLIHCHIPDFNALPDPKSENANIKGVAFDTTKVEKWDSGLVTFLIKVLTYCKRNQLQFDQSTLPQDLQNLISLSQAVPEKEDARRLSARKNLFARVGDLSIRIYDDCLESLTFIGECTRSVGHLLGGRQPFRWREFFVIMQDVGVNALPIVTLISFLVGLIIAFLGAVVLLRFGAAYYVSYLISYGMLREMGALMTGVILAGRTGAAFAAQIGSMKVTEEIDALTTLGISPIDFIVLPRMLALFLMMPLLAVYADFIGMVGGGLVSYGMLDIAPQIFQQGLKEAVTLNDFYLGVIKGTVFGVIIALTGCLRGMQCGNSADAVGVAATSAVVSGITLIIFSNAIIDWVAAIFGV